MWKTPAVILCLLITLSSVTNLEARPRFSFNIVNLGRLVISRSLPARAVFLIARIAFREVMSRSFFSRGSVSSRPSSNTDVEITIPTHHPHPISDLRTYTSTVTIDPEDYIPAEVLRIKYVNILDWRGRVILPQGGYLQLEEDGRFVFTDCGFEGYLNVYYDRKLTVWDSGDSPVLVVANYGKDELVVLQEESRLGAVAFRILFGTN